MENIKLYNDPLHFEMISICPDQKDRLASIGCESDKLLSDFESDTLLRFYTSYDQTTDQVVWLMFKEAKTKIKKILPNSCFVIHSPEIVRKILFDQGFEELTLEGSEKIELKDLLLLSPSDKINDKTLYLNLMSGTWTRFDFRDDQKTKEILLIHDETEEPVFCGNNRMILPKGVMTVNTLDQESFTQALDQKQMITKGFQIQQFSKERFMRIEFYKKTEKKRISAIRFF